MNAFERGNGGKVRSMKGVTFIGNIIVDYLKGIDSFPSVGNLSRIHSISRGVGGMAVNTSIDLKTLDPSMDVRVMGMVGDDENGCFVTEVLSSHGVDTSGVLMHKELPTSITDVFTMRSTGVRTFFQAQGAGAAYGYGEVDFSGIRTDIAHLGYALAMEKLDSYDDEYGTQMAKAMARLRSMGIKTSMDVVSEEDASKYASVVLPSLRQADYVFMNEVEASKTAGIPVRNSDGVLLLSQLREICAVLMSEGIREALILHAPEGGCMMNKNGRFYAVPSLDLPRGYIKGTVGAGDAYCAGMLYSILQGIEPELALSIAGASAACNLSEENTIDGMRGITDVLALEKQFSKRVRWAE